ncbi:MAG TPA: DinB family protein [Gemmatimonadales bacterium]|nr:DinB family protein [Gemmatimonadales bacterium]
MSGVTIERPAPSEYAPYYQQYIDQVPDGDVLDLLRRQVEETAALLAGVSERDAGFRYAEGKWSFRDVVGHLADVERIFVYRALCFARGERGMLPGFEENDYVAHAKFAGRPLAGLVAEFRAVRAATVAFFAGLDAEELRRPGTANRNPYTVRAVAYIVAGHERHHAKILAERYVAALKRP